MYKPILFVTLFLTSAFNSQAQRSIYLGFFGGFNNSWIINQNMMNSEDKIDFEPTFGGSYGGVFGWNFTDFQGIQVEGIMGKLGQKYTGLYMDSAGNYSTNILDFYDSQQELWYMHIPLLYKIRGGEPGGMGIGILVGPQISIRQQAHQTRKNNNLNAANSKPKIGDFNEPNTNDFSLLSYSAVFSFTSFNQLSDFFSLDLSFRFNYGLSDIIDKNARSKYHPSGDLDKNQTGALTPYGDNSYQSSTNAWVGIELHLYFHIPY
ncbi:MAG: hypothetical protein A3H98_10125 [Bacteroidetes bacterium RIFCSPLOWO2_02_FULL_36_8]|nr:MAG: hypothetical protein A3H98_10125 [Bacteroidetes bacterium RIFCSPLOWO2_02_FULL_36_8]OFY71290.1 MAG: hypothetical protein A3G23_02135 [Bacteroidetes bacterium RIFCSPLOWO2_12_FULL_37_12]